MRRRIWVAYLLALHAIAAVYAIRHGQNIAVLVGLKPSPEAPTIAPAHAVQTALDREIPAGATIFLGDSITDDLVTAAVVPLSVNYGIGRQRSDQLLAVMPAYRSMERARAVVVMIGTNDIAQDREEGIEQRYHSILAGVPAGVPVVLASVPPMTGEDVRPVVEASRRACAADRRCTFADAFSALSDVPGALRDDGVHLTPRGYEALIALLRRALVGKANRP